MTPDRIPARRLHDTCRALLVILAQHPAFERSIHDQLADGYPGGSDGPSGSGIPDPTLAAVLRRDRLAGAWADYVAEIDRLTQSVRALERIIARHGPQYDTTPLVRVHRCGVDPLCERLGVRWVIGRGGNVEACREHYEAVGAGTIDGFRRIREKEGAA